MRSDSGGVSSVAGIIGNRIVHARGVARVVARDDLEHKCRVGQVVGERADLIERAGEGDQAVAADPAVGRLEPDDPADGGGLANRAAGVRTQ